MAKAFQELQFKVLIEQDEDGVFVASAPAIPGCHSQGNSYEETIENIKEAIELCLEVANEDKSYNDKIDWSEAEREKTRFLGITEVPVKFGISS
jgi:predicted RNase H-like HicB family nuclease